MKVEQLAGVAILIQIKDLEVILNTMNTYVVLARGINVGGKNKISMSALRQCLEELKFKDVSTYIASGNIILKSHKSAGKVREQIEKILPKKFKLDSELVRVLVLTHAQLRAIVKNKPKGFGDHPGKYHSDVIFLMDLDSTRAMSVFDPKKGVDRVWPGVNAIYSERLSALRTKSRLSRIVATPAYKSMTIRSWNTTIKLLEALERGRP